MPTRGVNECHITVDDKIPSGRRVSIWINQDGSGSVTIWNRVNRVQAEVSLTREHWQELAAFIAERVRPK